MEGRGQSARVVLLSRGLRACGVHGAEHEATSWMPSPSALRIQHSLVPDWRILYAIHTIHYIRVACFAGVGIGTSPGVWVDRQKVTDRVTQTPRQA